MSTMQATNIMSGNARSKDNVHVIPTSISRTALDSLHAKLSAVDGGWLDGSNDDGQCNGGSKNVNNNIAHPIDSYCKLLKQIHDGVLSKTRRQTPLVNAGYAARMATTTFILERWINHVVAQGCDSVNKNTNADSECINVVLLGCGMDALGVWSKHYLSQDSLHQSGASDNDEDSEAPPPTPKVKVYEFDAWDNCILKRQALVNSGLLQEFFSFESASCNGREHQGTDCQTNAYNDDIKSTSDNSLCIISKGQIALEDIGSNKHQNEDDYFLVALDLRETCPSPSDGGNDDAIRQKSILSHAIHKVGLDTSQPTIVLSELVLAYLGYDGANAIMHAVAKDVLCGNEYSMFSCLEPVFPSESSGHSDSQRRDDGRTRILSVKESYSRDYRQQFLGKLQQGNSKYSSPPNTNANADPSSSWLHPLGSDSLSIQKRLEHCGFSPSNICYTTLGKAAANVAGIRRKSNAPKFLRAKEPFDEHVALALNLNCYGVVCAFSPNLLRTNPMDKSDCWRRDICPWISMNDDAASAVQIHPIASLLDDNHVRNLYGKIYIHLYDEYPAIRKMVKSALKMDLRANTTKVGNNTAVRNRFKDKGGDFWVAKDIGKSSIIGCVGVSQRKKRETDQIESMASSKVVEYEIQRLAVDDKSRGKGMGRKLLSVAEEYIRDQEARSNPGTKNASITIKLWAVTPECLIAANKLYESAEYKKEETFQAGTLCMNVYCKSLYL